MSTQSDTVTGPALAMLDVAAIPPGLRALDALCKEASVTVLGAGTIQCGRYLILFAGEVEPVGYAFRKACDVLGASLLDAILLPHAEPRLVPAVWRGVVRWPAPGDTVGALQAGSSPTMLKAVDAALKGTEVELVELRAADGLGGKAIATLWGETHAVEAAVALAHQAFAAGRSEGCTTAVIRNADDEVGRAVAPWSGFHGGWRG